VNERIDVDMLSSLAAEVLGSRENIRADLNDKGLRELLSVGTSAGGARPKAAVGLNESTGEIRSGQIDLPKEYTYWIIKFDTEKENKIGSCRIEHAYYEMAKDCGINMTECRILDTGDKAHFMTRRFDRAGGEKIHMQTLCALAHYDYMAQGRYSYDSLMGIMRMLNMPYDDMEQMFRRMVFNIVMKNQDDHTKNFSFLMNKDGKWRLSPAYDITYVFDPQKYWTHGQQMYIKGRIETEDITKAVLLDFAHDSKIRNAGDIIDTIPSAASEWRRYARSSGVPESSIEKIDGVLLKDI
jgi:serine/threonine-protein kinase HipA